MRQQAREWIEKYPSVRKLYDSIAGSRRLGSEGTAETYIVRLKSFIDYLGFNNPESTLQAILSGKVDAEKKIDEFIGYRLDTVGTSHSSVRNAFFAVKKWIELNGVEVKWRRSSYQPAQR